MLNFAFKFAAVFIAARSRKFKEPGFCERF